ncbi:MAG: TonB-dependent receptor [Flavobacteriales bacterium]
MLRSVFGPILSLWCSLFLPVVACAQPRACAHVLVGRVIDDHDRSPLAFAEVLVVGTERGAVADMEGRFRLEGLCAGEVILRFSHLGCDPVERTVIVPREQELVIRMEHHTHELRELEVVSKRPDEQVGHAQETIGAEEMVRNAGSGLANMIGKVAGVTLLNSGPTLSKPVIHGLSGNRIVIMNQGVRQEDQQWGGEHAPNLDPFTTDRITVVKGAASVQYGSDALGGVIVTEPVPLPREGPLSGSFHGVGISNGRGGAAGLQLQGGLGNWRGFGWRVQGSGRYLGDGQAARYVLSNTGDREAGASASFGYRDHRFSSTLYYSRFDRRLGILRAAHIGSISDLRTAIATGRPWFVADRTYAIDVPEQTMTHHLAKAELGYAITERTRLVATYGYQRDDREEFDLRRGGRSGIPALDLDLRVHSTDLVLKHWIGPRVHGRVGVSGALQQNLNVPGTGVRPLIPNYRRGSLGAFVIQHIPLSERLELEAGLRLEASKLEVAKFDVNDVLITPVHRFTNGAFHTGLAWSLKDSTMVRFGLGSAYRPPHVSELYSEGLHHGAAAIEQGDAGLRSERSLSASAEVDGSWADGRLTATLGLRSDRIDDMIYLRPDGTRLTIRGAFPVFQYVATDAVLHSADLQVGTRVGRRLKLQVRFNTVRAHDRGSGGWLFLMPADRASAELSYSTTAQGKWEAWEFTVHGTHVLEQRRVSEDIDLATPPPGYALCDLSITSGHALGRDRLRFGLHVNNLFNAAYRDYLDRFRYFADARGTDVRIWFGYAFGPR